MPQAATTALRLGVISPQDAIAAFTERQLLLPSFRWQDVWQAEHQRGFAVAGVMRADVLKVFRDAIDTKFAEGGTLAEFRKAIRPELAAKGFWGDVEITDPDTGEARVTRFDDRRLELIYDVNVRQSHAAGKWDRYQRTKQQFPLVLYRTMDDAYVRPLHRQWHNLVLSIDDPWVRSHWCPNGWRCRCVWVQTNQRGVDRLQASGQTLKFEAPPEDYVPYVNPHTGEVKAVPRGVDPGFGADPARGVGRDEALAETLLTKAARSPAYPTAVLAAQAATDMPALLVRRADQFAAWLAARSGPGQANGSVFAVGTVRPEVVRALQSVGTELETAVVAVRDFDAVQSAPVELCAKLPMLLQAPRAVLRLTDADALVYVIDITRADGTVAKLYVQLDQAGEGQRLRSLTVRSVSLEAPRALQDAARYQVAWGTWP